MDLLEGFGTFFDKEFTNDGLEFFSSSSFHVGCNSYFFTHIPKIHNAKNVKDFLPIILFGCLYKIIGKILGNSLALVVDNFISAK